MKLWKRYLFGHLVRSFLFFFLGIFILYLSIDFSINGLRFLSKESTSWFDIGKNYVCHFAKFFDLFSSLSFLLASLKVLLDLNSHGEIAAFQTAGLSAKRFLFPFFAFAAFLSLTSLANSQWIAPDAQTAADDFHQAHSKNGAKEKHLFSLALQDGSELIYQKYDSQKKELFDVFWIRSFDEIWHMNVLEIAQKNHIATGHFVDRFDRNNGQLELKESFDHHLFSDLPWDYSAALKFTPLENRPLTTLAHQAFSHGADKQKSAAHLHFKLTFPLLPILTIFAISRYALRFSRTRFPFLIIACSLFAFIGVATLLEAMLILAENQVLPPFLAIWSPLFLIFGISFFFFSRL